MLYSISVAAVVTCAHAAQPLEHIVNVGSIPIYEIDFPSKKITSGTFVGEITDQSLEVAATETDPGMILRPDIAVTDAEHHRFSCRAPNGHFLTNLRLADADKNVLELVVKSGSHGSVRSDKSSKSRKIRGGSQSPLTAVDPASLNVACINAIYLRQAVVDKIGNILLAEYENRATEAIPNSSVSFAKRLSIEIDDATVTMHGFIPKISVEGSWYHYGSYSYRFASPLLSNIWTQGWSQLTDVEQAHLQHNPVKGAVINYDGRRNEVRIKCVTAARGLLVTPLELKARLGSRPDAFGSVSRESTENTIYNKRGGFKVVASHALMEADLLAPDEPIYHASFDASLIEQTCKKIVAIYLESVEAGKPDYQQESAVDTEEERYVTCADCYLRLHHRITVPGDEQTGL